MGNFYNGLKRRNVFKVGAAYAIISWLIVQVTDTVFPTFDTPDWVGQTITIILLLGFPIALFLAWAFEMTPEGIKKTSAADLDQEVVQTPSDKSNQIIVALLCFAVLFLLIDDYYDDVALREAGTQALVNTPVATNAGPDPVNAAPIEEEPIENSIAVLVCDNLSPDPNNAYFAASLHEEVLNRLVKLNDLNVVARTSVLPYTAESRPSPIQIARELRVQSVMECSVAYADGRVAISAQLIDGNTGLHIWSDRYNREFQDVFGIQSDIAINIANALQTEFSITERQQIDRRPTANLEAYGLYLRALNVDRFESISLLDRVLALDPNFAEAHALKARQYAYAGRYIDNPEPLELANWTIAAEQAAETALSLDSSIGAAHVALGILQESRLEFDAARRSFERAYELSPADPIVLEWNSRFYRNQGEFDRSVEFGRLMVQLNPDDWWLKHLLGVTYQYSGSYQSAVAASLDAIRTDPAAPNPHVGLAISYAALGNARAALDELQIARSLGAESSEFRLGQMALTYGQLGLEDEVQTLYENFLRITEDEPQPLTIWAMMYVALGDYDQAYDTIVQALELRSPSDINMLFQLKWNGWSNSHLQSAPRFIALRETIFAD